MSGLWVLLALILISSLPMIAVFIWFRVAKYQFSIIRFLFALLAGAAAFFPALVMQELLNFPIFIQGTAAFFFKFFIQIALTEEFSRLLLLFVFFWISGLVNPAEGLDKPLSSNTIKKGTATGLIAGLGFSILESARYAASNMSIGIALLRIFTAALHAACGSRVGAAAVMFRTNPVQALLRVFTAIAIHGVYNFMVERPGLSSIVAVLIAVSALITAILSIRDGWSSEEPNDGSNSGVTLDKIDEKE